ncbi:MAG: hypothetical protein KIH44_013170 [Octadecabacter sp.]|nr:hypothetical protein [Octadecabacter sp.]
MLSWLNNPEYNKATVWGVSIILIVLTLLSYLYLPAFFAFTLLCSIYIILSSWAWYYSEWVENCIYQQQQETIGNRAILIELRLALAGSASAVIVLLLVALALNRDINSNYILLLCGVFGIAIPISFIAPKVKALLLGFLKPVCEIPFHIAIIWMAITTDERLLDARYKTMNRNAKRLLAFITGYESNLSVLHDSQDILRQLPKRL